MLSVVILSAVMLSVVMLSAVMLSVVILIVVMLSVIMPNADMLSDVNVSDTLLCVAVQGLYYKTFYGRTDFRNKLVCLSLASLSSLV